MTDHKHQRIAEPNTILRGQVGSGLHGVTTGADDRDEMGVCIEPRANVIGLDVTAATVRWSRTPIHCATCTTPAKGPASRTSDSMTTPLDVFLPLGMTSLGFTADSAGGDDGLGVVEGWTLPSYGEVVEVTFTDVNPNLARLLFGPDAPRVPLFWPRMKYRARRRHRGYTRTGRRR
ncbi:DNA polymerase beta superfamily protein [Gordonia iterans]|uniref:DNA polymerase beta superfamily protein n=1 Tax=Gordonia iterans TaxID=1004901 RepID=UPI001F291A0E|nr:nucleotidyltransferase domain-containing protein [Gordonia iterans]